MRVVERDEPYLAAGWLSRDLLPELCRERTGLPWPVFDGLPEITEAGRAGVAASTEVHGALVQVQTALAAALGTDDELTALARLATVILNECKFQRQTDSMREIALTRTVEIAQLADRMGFTNPIVQAIGTWNTLADDAPNIAALLGS